MSGIGTSICTLKLVAARKVLIHRGTNWFRQTVTATVSGFSPASVPNLSLFLFRNLAGVETAVANGGTMVASGANALASIDTNTSEMESVFSGKKQGAELLLTSRLYDGSSWELLGEGWFKLWSVQYEYDTDYGATPATPVSGSTVIWGKLAMVGGVTYGYNESDGLWYPVTFAGAGGAIHLELGQPGIPIST